MVKHEKQAVQSSRVDASFSRRNFLKTTGSVAAGATLLEQISARAFADENNTVKIALIGSGGRGGGAALNAMSTQGPTQLWAMADFFEKQMATRLDFLKKQNLGKQLDVPKERQFAGLDGYKNAIDSLPAGSLVILATPPAFRPIHLEYAVAKGMNVFMEKSFAVDAPGIRRVLKAGEEATKKNLVIAGGLMSRHRPGTEEVVRQIHDGAIGDVVTCWAYREHEPVPFAPKNPAMSELGHQIRNYSCFTWLNGSFMLDWLIHQLDICCWAKNAWPVSAQGQGGRQIRKVPDLLFDHYSVEFSFPDGTRMMAQGRHADRCWQFADSLIFGSKGIAHTGEGCYKPKIYKGYREVKENLVWKYEGPNVDPYQLEHDLLFAAIRENKPYNETERCAKAAMVGIMGRMAAESGNLITWDDAMKSELSLVPNLEQMTVDSPAPVLPDADGRYPVAMFGATKVL
jgi:myo-inositol 2-dehydrogenase / D-chiro-inositol 1-dehydrogenase